MLSRFKTLIQRRIAANRLGLSFKRAASFCTPQNIIGQNGKAVELHLPADAGTRGTFIDILLDDVYGLHRLPSSVSTVMDIGCHAGLFAAQARLKWPDAVIHGYEPNPQMRSYWERQAGSFRYAVYPEAVGMMSGFVSIHASSDSVHARSETVASSSIPQVSFGEAVHRLGVSVDLVKLDCEGAEWGILQDEDTWKRVQYLTMEFHLWAGYTLEALKERLHVMNWKINECFYQGSDFGILRAENIGFNLDGSTLG